MFKLIQIFRTSVKQKLTEKQDILAGSNWYSDRYQMVLVQRNLAILITLIALSGVILSVFTILRISTSRTVEPFVIEIEEKSGITNVIRPFIESQFAYDEVLRRYFLNKYLEARETYNFHTYNQNYFTVVRVLSTTNVYTQFRTHIYSGNNDSPLSLGEQGKVTINIRSVTKLASQQPNTFLSQIVFVKNTASSNKSTSETKIATIGYKYADLKMSEAERLVNPLGFQITSYKVDDYTL